MSGKARALEVLEVMSRLEEATLEAAHCVVEGASQEVVDRVGAIVRAETTMGWHPNMEASAVMRALRQGRSA